MPVAFLGTTATEVTEVTGKKYLLATDGARMHTDEIRVLGFQISDLKSGYRLTYVYLCGHSLDGLKMTVRDPQAGIDSGCGNTSLTGDVLMAGYLPWYGKKRAHLIEREREFAGLLQSGAEVAALREAAEEVRAAMVRTLKSRRAELAPSEKNAAAMANLDREIEAWLELSADEVIDGYRTGKFQARLRKSIRRTRK